jgi:hypothetical protein
MRRDAAWKRGETSRKDAKIAKDAEKESPGFPLRSLRLGERPNAAGRRVEAWMRQRDNPQIPPIYADFKMP